ncbi:hypothetical protein AVEN_54923-1 [Araneus ventricosus]|uniref:Uncharacterized protein n=1 Tax=Araneus ventricosus TaxID=182803 RepID=A0A4Y2FFR8_ARAVE|nr:hypothetical protein AVEN_243537-1 [Araneus ventricosus]GBM39347.1 hypothetical protein AVEN_54923-1 [Araneus ventricosus]
MPTASNWMMLQTPLGAFMNRCKATYHQCIPPNSEPGVQGYLSPMYTPELGAISARLLIINVYPRTRSHECKATYHHIIPRNSEPGVQGY